jgi:hypothetical protein
MRDLHNNIKPSRGISPAAGITGNSTTDSQIIDRQGFDAVEFVMQAGVITDGQFAVQDPGRRRREPVGRGRRRRGGLPRRGRHVRRDHRQQRLQEDRLQGQEAVLPPPPHAVGCDHRRLHSGWDVQVQRGDDHQEHRHRMRRHRERHHRARGHEAHGVRRQPADLSVRQRHRDLDSRHSAGQLPADGRRSQFDRGRHLPV